MWRLVCGLGLVLSFCGQDEATTHAVRQCCPDHNFAKGTLAFGFTCSDGSNLELSCPDSSYFVLHDKREAKLEDLIRRNRLSSNDTCLVQLQNGEENSSVAIICFSRMLEEDIYHHAEDKQWTTHIYSYCLMVSVLFLLATLVIYCSLPALWDLLGKCLMCFVGTLTVGYMSLAVLQQNFFNIDISQIVCIVFGFWTYFWLLSAFFWLFLVSLNIWYQSRYPIGKIRESTLWLIYLSVGFGIPILYQIIAIMLHHLPDMPLGPNIDHTSCWFQGVLGMWIYFTGPMAVLLLSNFIFFIMTLKLLWVNYKETRPHSRIQKLRLKMALYLKLFLLMGLTWIFELLSFTFSIDLYVTDVLNSLQGPIIFIVMVLTRKKVIKSFNSCNTIFNICVHCSRSSEYEDENSTEDMPEIQLYLNGNV